MSVQYGLTPNGWVGKPLSVIDDEIDAALRSSILGKSAVGTDGKLRPKSIAGQLKTILVDLIAALWDLLTAIYASKDPAQATDAAQDILCSLTGTRRNRPSYSTVPETLVGATGTPVPKGSVVTVTGTGARFDTTADAVIAAALAWDTNAGAGHNWLKGDLRKNAGNVYLCITAGLGAIVGPGPNTTAADIVDGAAHWRYLGAGDGFVVQPCQAETQGPIAALAGQLVTIGSPVVGWTGAYNVVDATLGAFLEGAAALRIRREEELHATGDAAQDAIRAAVLAVGQGSSKAVTTCSVFSNRSDAMSDGATPAGIPASMPPHSVLVVADYDGPDDPAFDALIGQAIWNSVGAGIRTTYGPAAGPYAMTSNVVDSQGVAQQVFWVRPQRRTITVQADVTYDNTAGVFPANGHDLIVGAILTFGAGFRSGRDVYGSAISAAIFEGPTSEDPGSTPCPGVLDVATQVTVAPAPLGASVAITLLQRAVFDSGVITVNLTGAAP